MCVVVADTTVAGIPVINAPSLSLNDITFNDPSNLFKAVILRVELNGVVQNYIQIQVAAPLQIDVSLLFSFTSIATM